MSVFEIFQWYLALRMVILDHVAVNHYLPIGNNIVGNLAQSEIPYERHFKYQLNTSNLCDH